MKRLRLLPLLILAHGADLSACDAALGPLETLRADARNTFSQQRVIGAEDPTSPARSPPFPTYDPQWADYQARLRVGDAMYFVAFNDATDAFWHDDYVFVRAGCVLFVVPHAIR